MTMEILKRSPTSHFANSETEDWFKLFDLRWLAIEFECYVQ